MTHDHQLREKYVILFQEFDPDEQNSLKIKLEEGLDQTAPRERGELIDSVGDGVGADVGDGGKEMIYADSVEDLITKANEERKQEKWDELSKSREPQADEQVIHDDKLEKVTEGDPRKQQFFSELSQGRTLEQIAEELHVTTRTLLKWRKEAQEREQRLTGQSPKEVKEDQPTAS